MKTKSKISTQKSNDGDQKYVKANSCKHEAKTQSEYFT